MFYYLDIRDYKGEICLESKDCNSKEELINLAKNLRSQAALLRLGNLQVRFLVCDEHLNMRGVTKHINFIEES